MPATPSLFLSHLYTVITFMCPQNLSSSGGKMQQEGSVAWPWRRWAEAQTWNIQSGECSGRGSQGSVMSHRPAEPGRVSGGTQLSRESLRPQCCTSPPGTARPGPLHREDPAQPAGGLALRACGTNQEVAAFSSAYPSPTVWIFKPFICSVSTEHF